MTETNKLNLLIQELQKLPGVGPKAAWRMAFWLLKNQNSLAKAINNAKIIKICGSCHSIICLCNSRKDQKKLAVVEDDLDLVALEHSGAFQGSYFVIGADIKINPNLFLEKIKNSQKIEEVIIATNPTTEGDIIALKIKKLLKEKYPKIKITRLARGLPTGGDIQYADERTLENAIRNRDEF